MDLIVYQNPEAKKKGINPFDYGALHTDLWKKEGLKQAFNKFNFDGCSYWCLPRCDTIRPKGAPQYPYPKVPVPTSWSWQRRQAYFRQFCVVQR